MALRTLSEGAGERYRSSQDLDVPLTGYPGLKVVIKRTFVEVQMVSHERVVDMVGLDGEWPLRGQFTTSCTERSFDGDSINDSWGARCLTHGRWSHDESTDEDSTGARSGTETSIVSEGRSASMSSSEGGRTSASTSSSQGKGQQAVPECMMMRHQQPHGEAAVFQPVDTRTSLIVKRMSATCTTTTFTKMLHRAGLGDAYDFIYVPRNLHRRTAFGFAFVNMVSNETALHAMKLLNGDSQWSLPGDEPVEVLWCYPYQGLQAQIDRYRNSPIMHSTVPDDMRPMLFCNGVRQPFPQPTIEIEAPKLSNCKKSRGRSVNGTLETN